MKIAALLVIVATTLALPRPIANQSADPLNLSAEFAGYRKWAQILKSPYEVPLEFWALCVAPKPSDWEAARKKYGPHTRRFIRVYANPTAVAALARSKKGPFPPGTIIVKEKLSESPHATPEGVAFMVKREKSKFPETSGWEFLYFPPSGDRRATHSSCASCHRSAANDYVFGEYPR